MCWLTWVHKCLEVICICNLVSIGMFAMYAPTIGLFHYFRKECVVQLQRREAGGMENFLTLAIQSFWSKFYVFRQLFTRNATVRPNSIAYINTIIFIYHVWRVRHYYISYECSTENMNYNKFAGKSNLNAFARALNGNANLFTFKLTTCWILSTQRVSSMFGWRFGIYHLSSRGLRATIGTDNSTTKIVDNKQRKHSLNARCIEWFQRVVKLNT